MKEYWNRFLRWGGWKYVFPLPVWAEVIVFAACCAGLIGIFWNGLEQWWPAYFLYALSAYGLTALGVKLPRLIRGMQNWMQNHPKVAGILKKQRAEIFLRNCIWTSLLTLPTAFLRSFPV